MQENTDETNTTKNNVYVQIRPSTEIGPPSIYFQRRNFHGHAVTPTQPSTFYLAQTVCGCREAIHRENSRGRCFESIGAEAYFYFSSKLWHLYGISMA